MPARNDQVQLVTPGGAVLSGPDRSIGGDRQPFGVAVAHGEDAGLAGIRVDGEDLAVADIRVGGVDRLLDLAVIVDAEVAHRQQQLTISGEFEDAAGLVEMSRELDFDAGLAFEDHLPRPGGANPGALAVEPNLRHRQGVAGAVGMRVVVGDEHLPAALDPAHLQPLAADRTAIVGARNQVLQRVEVERRGDVELVEAAAVLAHQVEPALPGHDHQIFAPERHRAAAARIGGRVDEIGPHRVPRRLDQGAFRGKLVFRPQFPVDIGDALARGEADPDADDQQQKHRAERELHQSLSPAAPRCRRSAGRGLSVAQSRVPKGAAPASRRRLAGARCDPAATV